MIKTLLSVALGIVIGAAGLAAAQHQGHTHGKVTVLSERNIDEKIDGKEAKVTMIEVSYGPGEATGPHRHAGAIFGYVLAGEFETALGDNEPMKLKAGDTFYEPRGVLHRVSRNPHAKHRTRVLAVMVAPRDAKKLTVLEQPMEER
jgi:quercetin dioxygenase-like cupin family protein